MAKKRRIGLKARQERHTHNRRYKFKDETLLKEFIHPSAYKELRELLQKLNPYLIDPGVNINNAKRLYFDLEKIIGRRQYVIDTLAIFLAKAKQTDCLAKPQSQFIRYLSDPVHCNFGISESSLKALILEAMRRYF